jgi:hypothetical protein
LPQLSNDSLNTFKSFFPARSASTGQELLLVKTPSGGLAVEFEGTLLGQLDDPGVMRDLFAGYVPSFPSLFFSVLDPNPTIGHTVSHLSPDFSLSLRLGWMFCDAGGTYRYFMSKNPNSEKMRSSVLDGFKAGPEDANL